MPAVKFNGAVIYDATGAVVSSTALPQLSSFQTATSNSIYDPVTNTVYSLTTGQSVWTGSWPFTVTSNYTFGAIAGSNIVYESGHRVVVEQF